MPRDHPVPETTPPADAGANDGTGPGVEVRGSDPLSLSLDDLRAHSTVERECTISCASGDRTTATWGGVPVARLLSATDAPRETTHVRVTSDDGYRACVEATAAFDAVVAVARGGEPLAASEPYATRLVGPAIDGERAVKGVVGIEPLALAPADDPTEFETLSLDDSTYG